MKGSRALAPLALALLALVLSPVATGQPDGVIKGLVEEGQLVEVSLNEIAACVPELEPDTPPSEILRAGMNGNCVYQRILAPDETLIVSFQVEAPNANANVPAQTGTWDLMATVRAVGGSVKLGVEAPGGLPPPEMDFADDVMYQTRENSEEYLGISGEFLAAHPGTYALNVTSDASNPVIVTLSIHTPMATVTLDADEVKVLEELRTRCCPQTSKSKFCVQLLPAVTSPTRAPETDICRMPPTNCGPNGRLRKLVLAGVGLDCGDQGLPPSFADLDELETLDMAYNKIGGTTAALADLVQQMPSLRRVYMRHTNLTGPLACSLVDNPTLTVVSLSGNEGITGEVPNCFLNDETLEELFLSFTGVSGLLPNVIPEDSPLRVLYAIGNGKVEPALNGDLPITLGNAKNLTFVDLSGNGFAGAIPALPDSLRMFNVSSNSLTALPAVLPSALKVLDASFNSLGGTIPPINFNLIHLNLQDNELEGGLPAFLPRNAAGRRRASRRLLWKEKITIDAMDANQEAKAKIQKDIQEVPELRFAVLSLNHLTGTLPPSWVTVPQNLHTLTLANNDFNGPLPDEWDLPQLAWLDLAGNLFEGSVPASLGDQPSLVHVDLRSNVLGGDLGPFAAALMDGSDRIVFLDLSDNYFEGAIPDDFAATNILKTISNVVLNGVPAQRVFDLSNNSFSGAAFPMWLVERVFQERDDCNCPISVAVNGEDDHLACPTAEEAAPYLKVLDRPNAREILTGYNFQCDAGNDTQVALLSVMDGSAVGSRDRKPGKGPAPQVSGLVGPGGVNKATQKKGLGAGAIAGIAVGSAAGLALLVAAAVLGERKTRNWRKGWSKEGRLNGAGGIGGGGGQDIARKRLLGAGWGSRVAAREQENAAFGVMPPVREI